MTALDRFHASWPRGVAPSIVEHFAGSADHVAPAMTIWSGAERMAVQFSSRNLARVEVVSCALPPGARWAQTLIACLMRDHVFLPVAPGASPLPYSRAHVDALGHLETKPAPAAPFATDPLVAFLDGRAWTAQAVEEVLTTAFQDAALPRAGARLVVNQPWWEPGGFLGLWLGLFVGAEVHTGVTDDEVHLLGPDVMVTAPGTLESQLVWAPRSMMGTAVITGDPSEADMRAAEKRGWRVVPVTPPGSSLT